MLRVMQSDLVSPKNCQDIRLEDQTAFKRKPNLRQETVQLNGLLHGLLQTLFRRVGIDRFSGGRFEVANA